MKSGPAASRPVTCVALMALVLVWVGCASQPRTDLEWHPVRFEVSLPAVRLAPSEYIQSVSVDVRGGRIVSVNRLLDDWDSEITWDNPGLVTLTCRARHFSSGLPNTKALAKFITVESSGTGELHLAARIETTSTTPTGRPDRELVIGRAEMVLKGANGRLGKK